MAGNERQGGLDFFRLVAALLVVAIHTSPLETWSANADFLLTRALARVAVPFFLMVTGQFLLPRRLFDAASDSGPLWRFIRKTLALYVAAMIAYLPLNFYARHFEGLNWLDFARLIAFDGTVYHLWYLPASVVGALIVWFTRLRFGWAMGVFLILYCAGLLGDSYYGFAERLPALASAYEAGFRLFSYARNGIFYAPVFLAMGAWMARAPRCPKGWRAAGLVLSLLCLIAEAFALRGLGVQRHDSMYVSLLPCMFFLYQWILSWKIRPCRRLASISMLVYLIHPYSIIAVRGLAKAWGLAEVLVGNSLVHYLAVCALSLGAGCAIQWLWALCRAPRCTGRAWIELDRDALRGNVEALRARLPGSCRLMAAVKANAYGHGAVLISRALNAMGVNAFCVASAEEGAQLRKGGISGDILVLGYTHPSQARLLRRFRLTQAVLDEAYAGALDAQRKKIKVHVKIDAGLHRLGARCEDIQAIGRIFGCKNLKVEGAFAHLSAAGLAPEDARQSLAQGRAFYQVIEQVKALGFRCPKAHLLASHGLFNCPELAGDFARVGIALYGALPECEELRPVLSIKARVALVRALSEGEGAGYGHQFVAKRSTRLAVLAIGYADGIPRALSMGVGHVLIDGHKCPIVGSICMDQMLVDVTDVPGVQSGDVAVVIGKSGEQQITASDMAGLVGTIPNEILSRLGGRLERMLV